MRPAYVMMTTRWIGRDGREVDLKARVGRLGDDVSVFAIHTMGWVQVLEIARFLEVRFDPRATSANAVAALDDLIHALDRGETSWLMKIHAYNGKTWTETTDTDAARLSRFVHDCVNFCARPDIPSAIRTRVLGAPALQRLQDPLIQRILDAWRETGGSIDHDLMAKVAAGTYGNVKLLAQTDDGRIVFHHYRASITGPWDHATRARFPGREVREAVPDRALADAVDRSARQTLTCAAPVLEHWAGPILTSKGPAMYDWLRASFPVRIAGDASDGRPDDSDALLVVCVPNRSKLQATG